MALCRSQRPQRAVGQTFHAVLGRNTQNLHACVCFPPPQVLLMIASNSSGAAGLTLNCATTAYLLDPPLNPGMEVRP